MASTGAPLSKKAHEPESLFESPALLLAVARSHCVLRALREAVTSEDAKFVLAFMGEPTRSGGVPIFFNRITPGMQHALSGKSPMGLLVFVVNWNGKC